MKLNFTNIYATSKQSKFSYLCYIAALTICILLLLPNTGTAQIPGYIVQPATNGGNKVLDPNSDGYVSKTTAGFIGNDIGADYSEINYRLFPQVLIEPHSDLKTGGSTNFTDLMKDPWYAFFDGTNFIFRVRVGNNSAASKGFSVLIDSDNIFSGTGTNPGFEYEVLLATNFDVRIIKLSNNATVYTASHLSNSQRSVALSTTNDNPDYFIDYFVPLSGFQGAITATTPLRLSGISVTSAQSGITGTAADIGGLNDLNYIDRNQAWTAAINSFPPTSPSDILNGGFKPLLTSAPVVKGPIAVTDVAVLGTSTEPAGTVISVYQNNILLGTTTLTANGTWSLAVAANTLVAGNTITAKAKNGNNSLSDASNAVLVGQAGQAGQIACSSPPPTPTLGTIPSSGKNIPVTIPGNTTTSFYVNLYRISDTGPVLVFTSAALAATTATYTFTSTLPSNGEHYAELVYANNANCVSERSNSSCTGNSTKALTAPTFATTSITAATTSITINTTANTYVTLFADDIEIAEGTATGTTITFNNLTLKNDQVLNVKISATGSCGASSANVTVGRIAPVILGSYCTVSAGSTLTFTGTSPEIGATVRMYNSGGTQIGTTTTVNANQLWSLTISGVTPGSYFARTSTASGTNLSANSNTISVTSQTATTGLTINAPINESAGSNGIVSGNAPANATVKVYIDGTLLGTTTALSNGTWSVTGLSPLELYLGGFVTATVTSGGLCESNQVNGSAVQCSMPPAAVSATFGAASLSVCNEGTVSATITNSEANIAYQITLNGVVTGNVTIGNGGTITVTSGPITAGGTLQIVARRNYSAACQTTLSASATVTLLTPVPAKPVIAAAASQVCYNSSTLINITSGLVANDKYQLKKDGVLFGAEVTYTSGTLSLNTGVINTSATFTVVHKNTSGCTATSDAVTVSPQGPANNVSVTVNKNSLCINEPVTISVATEYNNTSTYTYQIFQSFNNGTPTQVGTTLTGNGLVQSVTTPSLTTAGTYVYTVRVSSPTCSNVALTQSQTVVVGSSVSIATVGSTMNACYSTTLTGNQPVSGQGTWTLDSKPTGASNPVFSNVNQGNSIVMGLTSGTYVFRWTIKQTCNDGSTSSSYALLTVNANCPTTYNVNQPYYVNGYNNNDVLAYPYDSEGFDQTSTNNFSLVSGNLPAGVALNPTTGSIYVSNNGALAMFKGPYTVNITINATDALNNLTTNIPVTLTFYPEASQSSIDRTPVTTLPVEILYFTGKFQDGQAKLVWATATEKDNQYFQVERSLDGTNFKSLGQIAGAGNSIQVVKYAFTDKQAPQGTVYYRLKQVDYSTNYAYSKILGINCSNTTQTMVPQLLAYPNPTGGKIKLSISTGVATTYAIEVRNLTGQLLLTQAVNLDSNTSETELSLQHLPAGTYLVTARSADKQLVTRVVKN